MYLATCLAVQVSFLNACVQQLPVVDDTAAVNAQPDAVKFDVMWKSDTVVADVRAQRDTQLQVNATTISIAQPSAAMTALKPGAHLMVDDEGLFKIVSVAAQGNGMVLTVTPGSLPEAAESGRIEWDLGLDPAKAVGSILPGADANWVVDKGDFPTFKYSGMLGKISAGLEITNDDERTHLKASVEFPTTVKTVLTSDASVARGRMMGLFAFQGGQVTDFKQLLSGLEVDIEFTVEGGGQAFDEKIEFPWGIYFQTPMAGLPTFMGLSTTAVLRATTMRNDKISFKCKLKLTGDQGFTLVDGEPVPQGGGLKLEHYAADDYDVSTVFSSALSASMELPRYTLGVGKVTGIATSPPENSSGIYIFAKFESVTNAVVNVFLARGDKKFCTFMNNQIEAKVGGEIKVFGLSLSKDYQLWFAKGEDIKSGPNCDEVKKP